MVENQKSRMSTMVDVLVDLEQHWPKTDKKVVLIDFALQE